MNRSWWGWGEVQDELSATETKELIDRVSATSPTHDFTDHPPPDPNALDLADSRVSLPASLAELVSTDPTDRMSHARGKSFRDVVRNLVGDTTYVPDAIIRPRTEQDVIDVLDWASRQSIPVITYGAGSSVVGGVEPRFDGPSVSLDLSSLDQVLDIDRESMAARIQAGVYGPALESQLRPHGLTLRHFPQSFQYSTLGGWLATRSGGHFATLYTHIDDLTESIRAVTPVGTSESRRLPGSGAGPSPDRLLLGSEGALGVITEAWMRIRPRPRWQMTASVTFEDFGSAVDATRAVAQSGLYPTNCRLLDPGEAGNSAGVQTAGGVLVVAFESADHPVDAWLDRALQIVKEYGGTVASTRSREEQGKDASGAWRSAFIRMPYNRDALARHSVIAETFETACTWDAFAGLHEDLTDKVRRVLREVCGGGSLTCRFTHVYPDGPAPYYGISAPGRWSGIVTQWDEIKSAVSEVLDAHGCTITHHHAVGRDHRPWYDRQRPDVFATALRAAKSALDPAGILNPGVLI